MKKNSFLDLADLNVRVRNMDYVKSLHRRNEQYFCSSNHITKKADYYSLFEEFIELGKSIYDIGGHYIDRILYRPSIQIYKTDKLLLKEEILCNDNVENVIKNWCASYPVYFSTDGPENYKDENEIEIFTLLDMAVFSYLTLSALNNYYLRKHDEEDYQKGNKITFSSFTELKDDDLFEFLSTISNIMFQYERKVYHNNRPLLQEITSLTFNELTKKCELERVFENVYSIFWIMLKAQIFSMTNESKVFHICRCGTIIFGKAEHCDSCKRIIDRERKQKEKTES